MSLFNLRPSSFLLPSSFSLLVFSIACGWAPADPFPAANDGHPRIQLTGPADDGSHAVEVVGLPAADLAALRQVEPDDETWSALLRVAVASPEGAAGDRPLPMVGTYAVTDQGIRFEPRFPLDPGRAYEVVFDRARLPATGRHAEGSQAPPRRDVLTPPARAAATATRVVAVYPSASTIPENQLRFYIAFSGPMTVARAVDHFTLLDDAGGVVEAPFLPVDVALWNAGRTRFTLLFDPGRVKTGILPNERLGRALVRGRSYTLVVDGKWRDANGTPLATEYRHRFSVGPADTNGIDPAAWRLTEPPADGRQPLVVAFGKTLDYALLHRALIVSVADGRPVDGAIVLGEGETEWRFTPSMAWQPGEYRLTALPILEDGAGNRIGRPFEVDAAAGGEGADEPKAVTLPFRVSRSG